MLVNYRHRLPVLSIALLLCPDADGPALDGRFQQRLPDGLVYQDFRYNVVKVWEQPAGEILAGGLATLPLAPISAVDEKELPAVIRAMQERLEREASAGQALTLWTITYLLMGLTYPNELIDRLLQGVSSMKESVTYQKILREGLDEGRARGLAEGHAEGRSEGRSEEARRILVQLGRKRFGNPEPFVQAAIDAISDPEQLEQLATRVLDVTNWEALLAQP